MKRKVNEIGRKAFGRSLPFSELNALRRLVPFIEKSMGLESCEVLDVDDARAKMTAGGDELYPADKVEASEPGSPAVQFWNI